MIHGHGGRSMIYYHDSRCPWFSWLVVDQWSTIMGPVSPDLSLLKERLPVRLRTFTNSWNIFCINEGSLHLETYFNFKLIYLNHSEHKTFLQLVLMEYGSTQGREIKNPSTANEIQRSINLNRVAGQHEKKIKSQRKKLMLNDSEHSVRTLISVSQQGLVKTWTCWII